MTAIDKIRNTLIDRILVVDNEKLLEAISNIIDSTLSEGAMSLSSAQIEMLMMSEHDIENGNLISESELI